MTPRMRAFLMELEALCKKHGASIAGCGCCGSPFVEIEGEPKDAEDCIVAGSAGVSGASFRSLKECPTTEPRAPDPPPKPRHAPTADDFSKQLVKAKNPKRGYN